MVKTSSHIAPKMDSVISLSNYYVLTGLSIILIYISNKEKKVNSVIYMQYTCNQEKCE